ncbi:MMPL family transporter [Candidatus Sumerlaeota bacterium]|nr:MMPL family transporter [Candidatus Sumerlaeota bacterium]
MRRQFLRRIAETAFRFAAVSAAIIVLLTAISVTGIKRLRLDTGLSDFLPPQSPSSRLISDTVHDYRNLEPIVVSIRGEQGTAQSEVIKVAEALAEQLDNPAYFSNRILRMDELAQDYYESLSNTRLMALMTDNDWNFIRGLIQTPISTRQLTMERARRISAFVPRRMVEENDDPLGLLAAIRARISRTRAPIPISPSRGFFFSNVDQSLQMLLYPVKPSDDGVFAWQTAEFLGRAKNYLIERHPEWMYKFHIDVSGSHIETAEKLTALTRQVGMILVCSILFVLMVLVLVYRKVEAIGFVMLPPALGLVWALGVSHYYCRWMGINTINELGTIYTYFTGVTIAFLLITFGVGLNYNIHLFNRFTHELYRNRNYYRALQISYVETGRGVLASAFTSSLIFFSLYFTSFRNLKELGMLAGVAVLCNLAACLLVAPTLAALKHWLAKGTVHPVELYRINLTRLSDPALRTPRAALGAMMLLSIFFGLDFGKDGIHVLNLDFHPHFTSMAAYFFRAERPEGTSPGSEEIQTSRPGRPIVAIVEGDTLQEALERNDRLYDDLRKAQSDYGDKLGILAIDSLRVILPSLKTQERSLENLRNLDLNALNDSIAVASWRVGFHPALFRNFLAAISQMKARVSSSDANEYSIEYNWNSDGAFLRAVQRLVMHQGDIYRIATPIFPDPDGFSKTQIALLAGAVGQEENNVKFIGDPIIEREISTRLKSDLAMLVLLAAVSVSIALFLHFRGLRPALLALIPVMAQALWVGGMMSVAHVPLHLLTLMGIVLVITLAVDNSVGMLQHYRDLHSLDVRLAVVTAGRAVFLSCVVIGLLYGTLALTSFEGLRDLGQVVLFGTLANLVGTFVLLPAMIQIWGKQQSFLSVLKPAKEFE